MLSSRARRLAPALAVLALAGGAVAGCGGGGTSTAATAHGGSTQTTGTTDTTTTPLAKGPGGFPVGATDVKDLRHGLPHDDILAPSTISSLETGANRFGFALFTPGQQQITGARVAIYVAGHDGHDVRGPFIARRESLSVAKPYRSRTTTQDPDAAKEVYVTHLRFPTPGRKLIAALAYIHGQLQATSMIEVDLPAKGTPGGPPDVGERPPLIHTQTLASVNGHAASIETRVPPAPALLRYDFAKVYRHRPVVLVFATPLLCQSRVCGPVVDVEDELAHQYGNRVAFIHQEIYRDNKVARGFRPQVLAWHLPTEPWTFVLDRHGVIRSRFEGALSVSELRAAVQQVLPGG